MTLFLSLLPLYLFGNVHCAGMCGPLMILLAKNPFRAAYFLGRLLSYTLAGLLSAEIGLLFFHFLARYHLSGLLSLAFGVGIISLACCTFFGLALPGGKWIAHTVSPLLSKLLRFRGFSSLFLFGCTTVLLPCGQTLVVFSACALEAKPLVGLINGLLFAALTSPSLLLSMHAFKKIKERYHLWVGCATFLVGILALLRGCADLGFIPHFVVTPHAAFPLLLF